MSGTEQCQTYSEPHLLTKDPSPEGSNPTRLTAYKNQSYSCSDSEGLVSAMDRAAETDPRESALASAVLILASSFYCLTESQLVDNWVLLQVVSSASLQKSHQLLSFLDHYIKQVVKGDYFKQELELGKTRFSSKILHHS